MFYYKIQKNNFYIWSDKIKWKFWPFLWVFVKNTFLWNFEEKYKSLEKKYPWYKFSIWIWNKKIFIIWEEWLEKILAIS